MIRSLRIPAILLLLLFQTGCSEDAARLQGVEGQGLDAFELEVIDGSSALANAGDVHFIDEMRGAVVTHLGVLAVTEDGGYTWNTRDTGTAHPLRGVYFVNDMTGFAVGGIHAEAVILKTIDGGQTWVRKNAPVDAELHGVHFATESKGFIAGLGYIFATSDGGETWEQRYDFKGLLKGVHFADEDIGFAYGIRSTILQTTDGGVTWENASPKDIGFVYDVDFNDGVGVACGSDEILKSVDAGESWATAGEFVSLVFQAEVVDSKTIVAVGRGISENEWLRFGALHVSLDGGETWQSDDHAMHYMAVHCPNENLAIAVGSSRLVKIHFD
jgi:photosystem II stability/assembly factor-like uncharacterized protein